MKEIIAIIRPEKWRETVSALSALGIEAVTHHRVLGRGGQAGLRYLSHTKGPSTIRYLPKRLLSIYAEDSQADLAVEKILAVNRTGVIGDGKVFVTPCAEVPCECPQEAVFQPA